MLVSELLASTKKFRDRQYDSRKVILNKIVYFPIKKELHFIGNAPSIRNGKIYKLQMVFLGVESSDKKDTKHPITYTHYTRSGKRVRMYLTKPTKNSEVKVKCTCPDYYYTFEYYNQKHNALVGKHKPYIRKTTTYPERNPQHIPGVCKHICAFFIRLLRKDLIKLSRSETSYLNRNSIPV